MSISGATTVLDSATSAMVVREPYPHIVISNALPDDVYKRLSESFPALSSLPSDLAKTSNRRFNLFASWGPTELSSKDTPEPWQDFLAAHTSPEFVRKVFDLFPDATVGAGDQRAVLPNCLGPGLAEMLKLPEAIPEDQIIARATIAVNTPVSAPSSVRGPHIDSRWKAYVGLYYVRGTCDDSEGGDLALFKWKDGAERIDWTGRAELAAVEEFGRVKYAPNTYVLMLNTCDSLHGVTVRQPTPHMRRFAITSGWFPGVDEASLLGRRRGIWERVKEKIGGKFRAPTLSEYQN